MSSSNHTGRNLLLPCADHRHPQPASVQMSDRIDEWQRYLQSRGEVRIINYFLYLILQANTFQTRDLADQDEGDPGRHLCGLPVPGVPGGDWDHWPDVALDHSSHHHPRRHHDRHITLRGGLLQRPGELGHRYTVSDSFSSK